MFLEDFSNSYNEKNEKKDRLNVFFTRLMSPFLQGRAGQRNRWLLLLGIFVLIGIALLMVINKTVVLKMLPFDNKSELQIVLDMPEGSSLEQTSKVLHEIGGFLDTVNEITDYEVYAGTASPISFNGLIRQYYLRKGANMGDIQVNLIDKQHRQRKSHEIALAIRHPIQTIARKYSGNAKIVEVPPGPPVQAPIVAEIYGLDYQGQIRRLKRGVHVVVGTAGRVMDPMKRGTLDLSTLRISHNRSKVGVERFLRRSTNPTTRAVPLPPNNPRISLRQDSQDDAKVHSIISTDRNLPKSKQNSLTNN